MQQMEQRVLFVVVFLIFTLAVCAGVILLQIFLSKKESKWPGLILPIVSFGISLMAVLAILLFTVHTGTTTNMVDGEIIEQTVEFASRAVIIIQAINVFVLFNIPTVVLLIIYAACRGKQKRQRDLDKMNVQDLN